MAMIVLVVPLSAGAAASAAGNSRLAEYFVPDPIGGTPVPNRQLEALVALEERATSSFDPGVVAAAQGWTNTKTQARFIEVAVALSGNVTRANANARETVTAACGGAGGSVSAFHALVSVANGYEAACRPVTGANAKPFEVVAFVKKNLFVLFFNFATPAFPNAALNTVVASQYGLIPAAGIPRTILA